MKISVQNLGKRYNQNWIFKGVNLDILPNSQWAILGNNGSGKSTLLQTILGSQTASEGVVEFSSDGKVIPTEEVYTQCSIAAPYLDLFEELSFRENIEFQQKFKPFRQGISESDIITLGGLSAAADRPLKQFSSGMKQRVKLVLALTADSAVVLLDEPCSNLDKEGIEWYNILIQQFSKERIIVISSNSDINEMGFCENRIDIRDYKRRA